MQPFESLISWRELCADFGLISQDRKAQEAPWRSRKRWWAASPQDQLWQVPSWILRKGCPLNPPKKTFVLKWHLLLRLVWGTSTCTPTTPTSTSLESTWTSSGLLSLSRYNCFQYYESTKPILILYILLDSPEVCWGEGQGSSYWCITGWLLQGGQLDSFNLFTIIINWFLCSKSIASLIKTL